MNLLNTLWENINKDFIIYDLNDNLIIMGNASNLFTELGLFFLNLKVVKVSDEFIIVNINLGGDE